MIENIVDHQHQNINELNNNLEFEQKLLKRVIKNSSDDAIMCKYEKNLVQIMRDETLFVEILMQNNLLHNFYQFDVDCSQISAQFAQYMNLLTHKNSNMKILKIDAKTDDAILSIFDVLNDQNQFVFKFLNYIFIDINIEFFEKSHEKLKS